MSEETKVTTETASEETTTETTQDSSNEKLIAESKKYRNRAQEAEAREAKLKSKLEKIEEDKMMADGKKDELIAKYQTEIESLTANANKWNSYEESKKSSLLEKHPESEREKLSNLDLNTLEYLTEKINTAKANAPEVAGNPRKAFKDVKVDWADPDSLRDNWDNVVKRAISKSKN